MATDNEPQVTAKPEDVPYIELDEILHMMGKVGISESTVNSRWAKYFADRGDHLTARLYQMAASGTPQGKIDEHYDAEKSKPTLNLER